MAGFTLAGWAPLVPFAKQRAGLDEQQLGLLLLCLGIGSLCAMPMSGRATTLFGCRAVLTAATLAVCAALPGLAYFDQRPALMATLFVFGAGIGLIDCAANLQAVLVERAAEAPLMSGFHGFFSLAGGVAAALVSGLLSAHFSPLHSAGVVSVLSLVALAWSYAHLLPFGGESSGPAFALPHGIVLLMGLIACACFLAEGAVLDWSAVFLISERDVDPARGGIGYAFFAWTMTLGRLTGDRIVAFLGRRKVLLLGGLCASLGLIIVTTMPSLPAALVGFTMVGAGCSNIVPVAFSAAGNQKSMPESLAIPAITTMGYAGMLVGPAAIGFIAHVASLPAAFLIISVFLIGVAASGRFLKA